MVKWQPTLFKDNSLSQFYFPGFFFVLFLIHTYWGQSKYVEKFEFSRGIFEKFKILYILKKNSEFYVLTYKIVAILRKLGINH